MWESDAHPEEQSLLDKGIPCRGVASFSTICRSGWLSFPHILKTARVTSLTSPTLWPLKLFRSPQQRIIYYKGWSERTKNLQAWAYRSLEWLHVCPRLEHKIHCWITRWREGYQFSSEIEKSLQSQWFPHLRINITREKLTQLSKGH